MHDNVDIKAEFTQYWLEFAERHQDKMHVGDWAHLFAVLTGTALSLAEVPEEKLPELLEQARQVSDRVYRDANEFISMDTPLQ